MIWKWFGQPRLVNPTATQFTELKFKIKHRKRIDKGVIKIPILMTSLLKITCDARLAKNLGYKGDKF
jgi:hypothetical protein